MRRASSGRSMLECALSRAVQACSSYTPGLVLCVDYQRRVYATKTTAGLVVEDASGCAGFTLSSIVTLGRIRHSLDDYVAVLSISNLVPASKGSVQDDRTRLTGICRE